MQDKSDGKVWGWMSKLGAGNRMGPEVEDLAQAAGWPGVDGINTRTGACAYHADEFVNTVEFLFSTHKDGLMFPQA